MSERESKPASAGDTDGQRDEASREATTSTARSIPQIPLSRAATSKNTSPCQTPTQILGPMFAVAYKWRNSHLLHALEELLAKWEGRTPWPMITG